MSGINGMNNGKTRGKTPAGTQDTPPDLTDVEARVLLFTARRSTGADRHNNVAAVTKQEVLNVLGEDWEARLGNIVRANSYPEGEPYLVHLDYPLLKGVANRPLGNTKLLPKDVACLLQAIFKSAHKVLQVADHHEYRRIPLPEVKCDITRIVRCLGDNWEERLQATEISCRKEEGNVYMNFGQLLGIAGDVLEQRMEAGISSGR